MRGYSESEVFSEHEVRAHDAARRLVDGWPHARLVHPDGCEHWVRCHELARAARRALGALLMPLAGVRVVDGKYGGVDHSWIEWHSSRGCRRVLDVYAVGQLPQVQLVDAGRLLASHGAAYVAGADRQDVDHDVVIIITAHFERTLRAGARRARHDRSGLAGGPS